MKIENYAGKLLLVAILLSALSGISSAFPPLPMVISGSVHINGAPAPTGTEIKAMIGSEVKGSTTLSQPVIYGIVIEYKPGSIDLYVNGIKALSTNWSSEPKTLNLSVNQPPPIPNTFYGTVKLNSSDAPVGTIISGLIDNVTKGNTTITASGKYRIDISGDSSDHGKNIIFMVNNITAPQTAVFNISTPPPIVLNLIIDIDILAHYRSLGNNPNIVETTDLLKAGDDWSRNIAPQGFSAPITTQQLLMLAEEWVWS